MVWRAVRMAMKYVIVLDLNMAKMKWEALVKAKRTFVDAALCSGVHGGGEHAYSMWWEHMKSEHVCVSWRALRLEAGAQWW